MSKTFVALVTLAIICTCQNLTASASPYPGGVIWEDTTVPVATGIASNYSKTGTAQCKNVLGIVQWGQCGIQDAALKGKIKDIHHVDVVRDGSFIFKKINTNVYGN